MITSSASQLSDNVPARRRQALRLNNSVISPACELAQVVPDPEKVPTFGITS